MAEYKLCEMKSWYESRLRTPAYQFTVTSLDDPELAALRKETKRHNKAMRDLARQTGQEYYADNLRRVRVMPRGPRKVHASADYPHHTRGGAYDSYLPLRYGKRFDIYIQKDDKAYLLKEELRYGLRPGDQAVLDRHYNEQWDLEAKQRDEMYARGLVMYGKKWMRADIAIEKMQEDGNYIMADIYKRQQQANNNHSQDI